MANPKILLVEDNRDDADLILRANDATRLHSDLVVVADGEEALEYLFATGRHAGRDAADRPVVVILDLALPGMGGLDVLRAMRQEPKTRRIPVVILTGSDRATDIMAGYDLGANSFVHKPTGFAAFSAMVAQLERYWVLTNVRAPE
ncbi:two-component system response regulator [Paramagnetospirillum kuznetsovii]|uniref:Two-component system response regulator n=1 Tax=Paramagnetospirillum kuznetsovii TaxID=2053833 RepID=A0A364NZZ4_9PROT|nr:response regulator [Paramagnetospirillum kuznetsovii]RAU22623.1 two-component system response regulator [Paramagnetospirillum kuznetsovii]